MFVHKFAHFKIVIFIQRSYVTM